MSLIFAIASLRVNVGCWGLELTTSELRSVDLSLEAPVDSLLARGQGTSGPKSRSGEVLVSLRPADDVGL